MKRLIVVLVPALVLMAGAMSQRTLAQQSHPLKVAQNPALGAILTDASGRSVYLFTKDTTAGQSACYDKCATSWPAVPPADAMALPAGVPGALTTFDRTDGTKQVAYNGIPLYSFAKDAKAGDVTGQGVGGIWFVVSPGATFGPYAAPVGQGTPVPAPTLRVGFTTEYGAFLTDSTGKTLYILKKDKPGKSTCSGDCAKEWPPLAAADPLTLPAGIGGTLATITRDDGTAQVTYNGMPLYTFVDDKQPGDVTGQNKDEFFVATVSAGTSAGTPVASAAAGSAIQIMNFAFSPDSLEVPVGTTVTWTNQDSAAHTVTADDGSFDSGQLAHGATFSQTFVKAGTSSYHCMNHPKMTATIVVT